MLGASVQQTSSHNNLLCPIDCPSNHSTRFLRWKQHAILELYTVLQDQPEASFTRTYKSLELATAGAGETGLHNSSTHQRRKTKLRVTELKQTSRNNSPVG